MKLFGTMNINEKGSLSIGGCDTIELAKDYNTPLYVIDEELVRQNCRLFRDAFSKNGLETEVIYASKAFLNMAICKIIDEEGLSLDVVSGGELYTAIKAGFPIQKIYFHGNNKTAQELELAIRAGIGRIVVDNSYELELIEEICLSLNESVDILLRVNPGVEAHTHAFIQTSKNDSKFGESIFSEELINIIERALKSRHIKLKGLHCHIGSQIFEEESFYSVANIMLEFIAKLKTNQGFITEELNLGGGFGVYYSQEDAPIDIKSCLQNVLGLVRDQASVLNIKVPKLMIEPGRAIVANAGTTLYEVGGIKRTYGGREYIFVDGGMTDNPRTALYDAKYEAIIAGKAANEGKALYTIAGKCCESGDIIIKDIELPEAEKGDILAVLCTGAYNYSMSSNYNRIPKPAVVFVKDGKARLTVKRESYEDILRNDM
ncbi:MAG: diaminopimelate decarboxylase [Clostridia bacterium]|jgi:diaminopimelate decarboxylase|nr:diaminopimelate decarboxylase [Clostridia bacterium]